MSSVSPKVIRIGVPSGAPASCAAEVEVGVVEDAEVLGSEVLVPGSPASTVPPHAESDMTASRASASTRRRWARRVRGGLERLIVVTMWREVHERRRERGAACRRGDGVGVDFRGEPVGEGLMGLGA